MAIVNPTVYNDPTQEYQKYMAALLPAIQGEAQKAAQGQIGLLQSTLAPERAAAEERLKGTLASRGLSYSGALSGGLGKIGQEYLRQLALGTQNIGIQTQQDVASRLGSQTAAVLGLSEAQRASQERWARAEADRQANIEQMEKQAELQKEIERYKKSLDIAGSTSGTPTYEAVTPGGINPYSILPGNARRI